MSKTKKHQKILIVDHCEINRSILADMLGNEYETVEAENGNEAISYLRQHPKEISLILLELFLPETDGLEVLRRMEQNHWLAQIPAVVICAANTPSQIERAYELGAADFILRPFDTIIVRRRIANTLLLYARRKRLFAIAEKQISEREKLNRQISDILSRIVDFRNGDNSLHTLHVRMLTEMLLKALAQKNDKYHLSQQKISLISTASALHDIGKLSIDEKILSKPGKLTEAESEIVKMHPIIGSDMLKKLPVPNNEDPLVRTACEICRWHHERYDGSGYPDGLKGEEIPLSAQVVALADTYEALVSEHPYRKAIPHETAVKMILTGKCGAFHPLLLECLSENSNRFREELRHDAEENLLYRNMENTIAEIQNYEELGVSARTLRLLDRERMNYQARLEDLRKKSVLDPLTGLFNHAGARELICQRLKSSPDSKFALIIFDIDHFKSVNDNHGHHFGDMVLKHTAENLTRCLRPEDISARAGGDEFLVFLEYETSVEQIIQRIFTSLCGRYENLTLTVSMGIARTTEIGRDYDTLFQAADQALYCAKRSGRKKYSFFQDSMIHMFSLISEIE